MTAIAKLYLAVVANPRGTLAFHDFERLIVAAGFVLMRVRGSHKAYKHPSVDRLLIIQPRGKEAKPLSSRRVS
jgi:predicted RNA binding protein YcfA (HicA-like mRNA interferase family)